MFLIDFYKAGHIYQYPKGTEVIYSNLTPRKSRVKGVDYVVVAGVQYFVIEYLISRFNESFFERDIDIVVEEYVHLMDRALGPGSVTPEHVHALHRLGYLPLELKALKEGTVAPIGVPIVTIKNTKPEFFWLVNYLETVMSQVLWRPCTTATIAYVYRKEFERHVALTGYDRSFIDWQGHNFSARGTAGSEDSVLCDLGHLISFTGSDTVSGIPFCEAFYGMKGKFVSGSVPATEHSVMCMGTMEDELGTFRRLITEVYPNGIVSIVSDTWDFWKVMTEYLPALKSEIMARDGRVVIRPDSGDPVDIICGTLCNVSDVTENFAGLDPNSEDANRTWEDILLDEVSEDTPHGECGPSEYKNKYIVNGKAYTATIHNIGWNRYDKQYYYIDMYERAKISVVEEELTPEMIGAYELLWNTFGGTVNHKSFKMLDTHVGLIYGDAITMDRQKEILRKLEAKGFCASNLVFGIGSFSYAYNTRDTFGFAVKATWGQVNGEAREIFKDPKTDTGFKKSAKGLLKVYEEDGVLKLKDQCTPQEETESLLEVVFRDGKLIRNESLSEIRSRVIDQF